MDSRALLVVCAVLLAAPKFAAAAEPTAEEREAARGLMDAGKAHAKAGDLEQALEAYQKAHEIMHVPTTGLAVAKSQVALGHLLAAREIALEVSQMPREKGEHPVFERARKEAKHLAAQLDARIPTLKVNVRGGHQATITIDDVVVPPEKAVEPVRVDPGKHVVVAKGKDGYVGRVELGLAEKENRNLDIALVPTNEGIDEGPAPRRVTVPSLEGARGQRTTTANVLLYGGFGLAATGLLVGGVTGVITLSKAGDVKPQCENNICDPATASDLDTARSMATISNIGFAAAGVGAVLGVVGLLLPRTQETTLGSVRIVPTGSGLRGTF